ncbi:MAG: ABC transporter substrate-binding protein [Clostridia bacterium]
MKKNLFFQLICLLLVAAMFLSGCGQPAKTPGTDDVDATATPSEKKIIIAMTGDVNTWNPYMYNEIVANSIQKHVFDPLIDVDGDMKQIPCLATEWTTEDGGKTWLFTLREGVTFSNGNPFTADDVAYSFERCKALNKGWGDSTASLESVEIVDELHVKFICNTVDAIFPASAKNIMILDKETYESLDDTGMESTIVGTGRYVVSEYVRDDHTTLTLNPTYWGEKPAAETVVFRTIPNDGTRTASLVAQEVDLIANVPVTDVSMLETKDYLKVMSAPSIGVMFYNMAMTKEDPSKDAQMPIKSPDGSNPLSVRDVREAIVRAIDSNQIIEKVLNGYAVYAPTCVPEGFNGYNPNIKGYEFDTAKAEALLDGAGYPRQDDGYRFEITLDCTNDRYINDAAQATAIAGYLDKVGIKCNVNAMSRSVFFNYIRIHDESDNTHFLQSGWSDTSGESVLLARDLLYGTTLEGRVKEGVGGANRGYYNNLKVNELIDKALATSDYAERDKIMQEVWQIAHDDVAMFTTLYTSDVYAVNSRVSYTPREDQYIFAWNFTFAN